MATYFLGKFLTGKASVEEIARAAKATKLDPEDLYDRTAPHVYGLMLEMYGPEKEAEVDEALAIATKYDLGDIARKLQEWKTDTARRQAKAVSGMATLGRQGLGPKSTPDTESVVASFLTGKKGSLPQQMGTLKKATGMGGRRKTRSRRRKTRTAKKSRRTYK